MLEYMAKIVFGRFIYRIVPEWSESAYILHERKIITRRICDVMHRLKSNYANFKYYKKYFYHTNLMTFKFLY